MAKQASFFRRTAASMFGLMLVLQLVGMAISGSLVLWPLMRTSSNDLAALMVLSAQTWMELPEAARPAYAEELLGSHRLQIEPETARLPGESSRLPLALVLQDELSSRIGSDVSIHTWQIGDHQWYGADLPMAGQLLRLSFPAERIGTRPLSAILSTLAAIVLASLLPIWWLAHRLARPLADLGQATEAIARGETPEVRLDDAPAEITDLAERFNRMAREVQTLLKNRDLMLAGLSHDLRTPLARARMALELGRDDPTMLGRIEAYLDDVNHLIQQYIDFARGVDDGEGVTLVSVHETVSEICRDYREAGHDVRFFAAQAGSTLADRNTLVRVLRNLIDNAFRHGAPPVEVNLTENEHGANLLVRDHGPGLTGADPEELLAPFARGDQARGQPGSGLGLSIISRLCRQGGWVFELREHPTVGLEARLAIPA